MANATSPNSSNLSDLPAEVILHDLLPYLDSGVIWALARTDRAFYKICKDETFWECKFRTKFAEFRPAMKEYSVKTWHFLYRRFEHPKVFLWGEDRNGRLGLRNPQRVRALVGKVPYPAKFDNLDATTTTLIAGSCATYFIDSAGRLFITGSLKDSSFARAQISILDYPEAETWVPLRLDLPARVLDVKSGLYHSIVLDIQGDVWNLMCWGRPFRVTTSLFGRSTGKDVIAVTAGGEFCAALTSSREVFVWWPYDTPTYPRYQHTLMEVRKREGDIRASSKNVIPCAPWDFQPAIMHLPALPRLPKLRASSEDGSPEESGEPYLVQIAGMRGQLIALTNQGHVLKCTHLSDPSTGIKQWLYLPQFSEPVYLENYCAPYDVVEPPISFRINKITACWKNFAAYSTDPENTSVVLFGNIDTDSFSHPIVTPELQGSSIRSIDIGYSHFTALTAEGKMFTWGLFSEGALGLGDPADLPIGSPGGLAEEEHKNMVRLGRVPYPSSLVPAVTVPTEVKFDYDSRKPREYFCISATAGAYHTGALVVDLEESEDESYYDYTLEDQMPWMALPSHAI